MIMRTWRGVADAGAADDYQRHFETAVIPNLRRLPGHRGAWLLRREAGGRVEFVAVTLWDSIASVTAFAGDDPEAAHIEPDGRATLVEFDAFARNYAVVCDTVGSL
ncbi:MAG TPA: hypothetical protein VIR38_09490 [Thalassobaculum sp.]